MKITIFRGTKEIGGTLIEIKSLNNRILIDAGYPLFLNGNPIDDTIAKMPYQKLLENGVLPSIKGLYKWEDADFDAVVISHAHIDHYGLIKYINPEIPIYMSEGTEKLIEITKLFIDRAYPEFNACRFKMYETFQIGDIVIKPYLMDHSAYDAAAFEIMADEKVIIYTGDFRGHGRKSVCLDSFIDNVSKNSNVLIIEGTMLGRLDEEVLTENDLEENIVNEVKYKDIPILFQSSSQNIDRIVSFYRAAIRTRKIFVVDVYTANVLYELNKLGNRIPYPSREYSNIKVFYPTRLTNKIFNSIGEKYAKRFSSFHISKEDLTNIQNNVIMMVRPSMQKDIEKCRLHDGIFIYSLWQGYRESLYQQKFENYLRERGFTTRLLHTSGHASLDDIKKVIDTLEPNTVIPIHTLMPISFLEISKNVELLHDGISYEVN